MSPEKEFFVTDEFNIFYNSQLMTKLSRILTNRYRFCLFLKEWEQTDGGRVLSAIQKRARGMAGIQSAPIEGVSRAILGGVLEARRRILIKDRISRNGIFARDPAKQAQKKLP